MMTTQERQDPTGASWIRCLGKDCPCQQRADMRPPELSPTATKRKIS